MRVVNPRLTTAGPIDSAIYVERIALITNLFNPSQTPIELMLPTRIQEVSVAT